MIRTVLRLYVYKVRNLFLYFGWLCLCFSIFIALLELLVFLIDQPFTTYPLCTLSPLTSKNWQLPSSYLIVDTRKFIRTSWLPSFFLMSGAFVVFFHLYFAVFLSLSFRACYKCVFRLCLYYLCAENVCVTSLLCAPPRSRCSLLCSTSQKCVRKEACLRAEKCFKSCLLVFVLVFGVCVSMMYVFLSLFVCLSAMRCVWLMPSL